MKKQGEGAGDMTKQGRGRAAGCIMGKMLWWLLAAACLCLFGAVGYLQQTLPDRYTITRGSALVISRLVESRPVAGGHTVALVGRQGGEESYVTSLRLLGAVPIKQATVTVVDAPVVTVCGTPFGIKLYTDGVLIVGMDDVRTAAGKVNPAAAAGIRVGDTIVSIDGRAVTTNEQVAAAINAAGGHSVTMLIRREGITFSAVFTPARAAEGEGYKAGLWVRDSTAGIGMLTFYEPESRAFGGLGHAVSDADTGETLSVGSGEVVPARIFGVEKGEEGTPGELCGSFEPGTLGRLQVNAADGLYGCLTHLPAGGVSMPVAMKQEVQIGAVQILTTVNGTTPELYDAEIVQVRYHASAATRHLVLRVTDSRLLALTGGIVQGMSGSPIIQNGRLVGAVTHVLVDDPTAGYGIFAETMLEEAEQAAQTAPAA